MRRAIQVGFLILFSVLMITGRVQIWLGIFLISLLAAPFLGRIYCGYICPIDTLTTAAKGIAKKRKWRIPEWIKNPMIRYLALAALLVAMIFSVRSGARLPILPAITAVAVVLSLLFEEALWHRYLCPYGTLLSLSARLGWRGYRVTADDCISCGRCEKVCPSHAISGSDITTGSPAQVQTAECLLCGRCAEICPVDAINRV
ncbi:MAG: 4Fe-4S binding protein [Bacillota bacterium]